MGRVVVQGDSRGVASNDIKGEGKLTSEKYDRRVLTEKKEE